jgi:acetyl-CoA carboxylase carboxyltransferase component
MKSTRLCRAQVGGRHDTKDASGNHHQIAHRDEQLHGPVVRWCAPLQIRRRKSPRSECPAEAHDPRGRTARGLG